ncbi:RHS repeat-associated core domain-containing protein [Sorangium cellulosum]|uniref:RHS repeat-associated core domain-containing protein n=1 Tax=Sorangium cellulosum TaxID=56 RepID=UPI001F1BF469|nr:RHS repeat-associated core domain-containing protein [Sorangium cellulosum]
MVTSQAYDFKGNLLQASRRLRSEVHAGADWSVLAALTDVTAIAAAAEPLLEAESFDTQTAYDALNRPTSMTAPDGSEIEPTYNEAGLLQHIEVYVRGAWTTFVEDIDYDAKGQRERIDYGNNTSTEYTYDPLTFRLARLRTTRGSNGAVLQNLTYTYDAVGNIVEIKDSARQTVFFNNDVVSPNAQYVYDADYRLIEATGREHAGGLADVQRDQNDLLIQALPHPNDAQALRNYTEKYVYDAVGNLLRMEHHAGAGTWIRRYAYEATSNRLVSTSMPGDPVDGPYSRTYAHDAHGNMTAMPHIAALTWDENDHVRSTNLGGGGVVYYTYDAAGQRVRKVWEHSGIIEERIYVGGYEVYRKRDATGLVLERQTLHVMDGARRVAMVETKTVDTSGPFTVTPRVRYQLDNHLGSASLEVDGAGLVIGYEEYHPYGTTAYWSASSAVEVSRKRYRYTGKEKDEETGLYYHGARYYAPWLGRWASADPAGMVDGTNLYRYVRSNPVILTDPTGKQPVPKIVPPQIAEAAQSALARAAARWGAAEVISGAAAAAGPKAAAVGASAVELGLSSGAVAAYAAGVLGSMALMTNIYMQRSASIARYGNPWGMPSTDAAFPVQRHLRDTLPTPIVEIGGTSPSLSLSASPTPSPSPAPSPTPSPSPPQPESQPQPQDDEEKRRQTRETVNLDTGTLIAASSLRDPWLTAGVNLFLADKNLVATQAVINEFLAGPIKVAGATEKTLAAALLARVTVIPNDPSARVMNLQAPSKKKQEILGPVDRIAFGTGDKLGIRTVSSDEKFRKEAEKQGVHLNVVIHPPNPYATR